MTILNDNGGSKQRETLDRLSARQSAFDGRILNSCARRDGVCIGKKDKMPWNRRGDGRSNIESNTRNNDALSQHDRRGGGGKRWQGMKGSKLDYNKSGRTVKSCKRQPFANECTAIECAEIKTSEIGSTGNGALVFHSGLDTKQNYTTGLM